MKLVLTHVFLLIALVSALYSTPAFAQARCAFVFKDAKSERTSEETGRRSIADTLIVENLPGVSSSYAFWGQTMVAPAKYQNALTILAKEGLTIDGIQKAHRELSEGKATLKFRAGSDAKVIGRHSFKTFSALGKEEVQAVEENPFLHFEQAREVKHHGNRGVEDRFVIGDILFPSVGHHKKFTSFLSKETLELARKKNVSEEAVNTAILKDLLESTIQEAKLGLKKGEESVPVVLARLEWRLKSLGLYYENTAVSKGRYMESDFSRISTNRSQELAEAVTDALAIEYDIVKTESSGLVRGFRPKLTDPFAVWVEYMKQVVDGKALVRAKKTLAELKALEERLPKAYAAMFRDYYMTRAMTGTRMLETDAKTIVNEFKKFEEKYVNKKTAEKERVPLIPIGFIAGFGKKPSSYASHLEKYYFPDTTVYRGISNPRNLTNGDVVSYFSSFKGRFASEAARSDFNRREELAKLAMLQFNVDLIENRMADIAIEHATKHLMYENPNSSKTYFVSTTDFDTVAFRFAVDKGYITSGSSGRDGNSHLVIESMLPRQGAITFDSFRNIDDTFRNYFPRQREVAIAGGIDPLSVVRIYVVAHYKENAETPTVGPEKHGEIIRVFERNPKKPDEILVKEPNDRGEWIVIERLMSALSNS